MPGHIIFYQGYGPGQGADIAVQYAGKEIVDLYHNKSLYSGVTIFVSAKVVRIALQAGFWPKTYSMSISNA